ncbi:MAG: hypothetical protein LBO75_02800 [Bifidobacteriaceae bacterium]|jgi:hypothetical protein|nr:hypothetical protein [Bifidobacteriaceae bacterium]
MRTTLTLTEEAEMLIKEAIAERGESFKSVVNAAIVKGLRDRAQQKPVTFPTYSLGEATVDLTHTSRVLAELDVTERVGLEGS